MDTPEDRTAATNARGDARAAGAGSDLSLVYLNDIGRIPRLTAEQETELAAQIAASRRAQERLQADASLSGSARHELETLVAVGQQARTRLVEANLRLVVHVARRYRISSMTLADCVQEGNFGLLAAVDRFDGTKGCRFTTYATYWIRQAIVRGQINRGRTIRLPVPVSNLVRRYRTTVATLEQHLGRAATRDEIAAASGLGALDPDAIERMTDVVDLQTRTHDDEWTTRDVPDWQPGVDEVVCVRERQRAIHAILATYPQRTRTIVELRFGLVDDHERSLAEIGRLVGLTKERVRQIIRDVLRELAEPCAAWNDLTDDAHRSIV